MCLMLRVLLSDLPDLLLDLRGRPKAEAMGETIPPPGGIMAVLETLCRLLSDGGGDSLCKNRDLELGGS